MLALAGTKGRVSGEVGSAIDIGSNFLAFGRDSCSRNTFSGRCHFCNLYNDDEAVKESNLGRNRVGGGANESGLKAGYQALN